MYHRLTSNRKSRPVQKLIYEKKSFETRRVVVAAGHTTGKLAAKVDPTLPRHSKIHWNHLIQRTDTERLWQFFPTDDWQDLVEFQKLKFKKNHRGSVERAYVPVFPVQGQMWSVSPSSPTKTVIWCFILMPTYCSGFCWISHNKSKGELTEPPKDVRSTDSIMMPNAVHRISSDWENFLTFLM